MELFYRGKILDKIMKNLVYSTSEIDRFSELL